VSLTRQIRLWGFNGGISVAEVSGTGYVGGLFLSVSYVVGGLLANRITFRTAIKREDLSTDRRRHWPIFIA